MRPTWGVDEGNLEGLKAFAFRDMSTYHSSAEMKGGVPEQLHGSPRPRDSAPQVREEAQRTVMTVSFRSRPLSKSILNRPPDNCVSSLRN